MSNSYGVAFPTAGSPYSAASSYRAVSPVPQQQQQQVQIQPGSITYTTTTTADGRIQYNQFRAEARSYQTAQGPVHGIQWVPVSISYELPSNAQLAGPDFPWSRPNDKETQRAFKEWQYEQEKRVKKEEKDSAKRMKEWERERREREKAEEKEFRRMQERDLQRGGRSRRPSDAGYGPDLTYPASNNTGYIRTRSRSRVRRDSVGQEELTRAMAEMAMENDLAGFDPDSRWGERERRNSNVGRSRKVSVHERPRRISTHEHERIRKTSGPHYPPAYLAGGQPAYGAPPAPARVSYSDRMSPYMGGGGLPPSSATSPVYPPGHIYAGKPIPGMRAGNMTSSYRAPSPTPRPSMPLELPVAFTRPPSLAVPYTYFERFRIISDLNNMFQQLPHMPPVLAPHDVWPEDWIRCFEDIARTWVGEWPDRHKAFKRPHKLVAELIDVWNASFFSLRGVELILCRGRQRLSGPKAGRYDDRLDNDGFSDEESDTISSVSSDSDTENRYEFYGSSQTHYGGNPWLVDSREAHRARKARKLAEKQKKTNRRERERAGSGYTIYLSCINDGQPRFPYPPTGYPS